MKLFRIITALVLIALMSASIAKADLLTDLYGVDINDASNYKDGNTLYQLFNKYFDLNETTGYSSSNDMFNDLGVDPNSVWTTQGSQLVGAFKVAAMGHEMSVAGSDGNVLGSFIDLAGTTNIQTANGITNLGANVIDLPDGEQISFQLDVSQHGDLQYGWSSDPSANADIQANGLLGDDMIHMIAFDITDIYNLTFDTEFKSVYMLAWEDLHLTGAGVGHAADWDYQDFVAIVTNLTPVSTNTPEPATWMIFLLGGAGSSVLAWRKKKNRNR